MKIQSIVESGLCSSDQLFHMFLSVFSLGESVAAVPSVLVQGAIIPMCPSTVNSAH